MDVPHTHRHTRTQTHTHTHTRYGHHLPANKLYKETTTGLTPGTRKMKEIEIM